MNRFAKLIAVAAIAASVATPALAWGEREQGALAGIVGTLILQNAMRNAQPYPTPYPAPVYVPPPVVHVPAPVYIPQPQYRPMWRRVDVYIPECNCVRTIDVQVQ